MVRKQKVTGIDRAIEMAGGVVLLAKELDVVYQCVQDWRKKGKVPPQHAPQVEAFTGGEVRCETICPGVRWDLIRAAR